MSDWVAAQSHTPSVGEPLVTEYKRALTIVTALLTVQLDVRLHLDLFERALFPDSRCGGQGASCGPWGRGRTTDSKSGLAAQKRRPEYHATGHRRGEEPHARDHVASRSEFRNGQTQQECMDF